MLILVELDAIQNSVSKILQFQLLFLPMLLFRQIGNKSKALLCENFSVLFESIFITIFFFSFDERK